MNIVALWAAMLRETSSLNTPPPANHAGRPAAPAQQDSGPGTIPRPA